MRIEIDTNKKTIKLLEDANFGEFLQFIQDIFPNDEWKNYDIKKFVLEISSPPIGIPQPYLQQPYDQIVWKTGTGTGTAPSLFGSQLIGNISHNVQKNDVQTYTTCNETSFNDHIGHS